MTAPPPSPIEFKTFVSPNSEGVDIVSVPITTFRRELMVSDVSRAISRIRSEVAKANDGRLPDYKNYSLSYSLSINGDEALAIRWTLDGTFGVPGDYSSL